MIGDFHFLRPEWLYALIGAALLPREAQPALAVKTMNVVAAQGEVADPVGTDIDVDIRRDSGDSCRHLGTAFFDRAVDELFGAEILDALHM